MSIEKEKFALLHDYIHGKIKNQRDFTVFWIQVNWWSTSKQNYKVWPNSIKHRSSRFSILKLPQEMFTRNTPQIQYQGVPLVAEFIVKLTICRVKCKKHIHSACYYLLGTCLDVFLNRINGIFLYFISFTILLLISWCLRLLLIFGDLLVQD